MWNPVQQEPQSSFLVPVTAPDVDTNASPTVCIPLATVWRPFVLGALVQLTMPSTWAGDPSTVAIALARATELLSQVAEAGACVNLAFQLSESCGLQYSLDGGTTWIDFTNWNEYFCTCVAACVTPKPPEPPLIGPGLDQWACNLAGYIVYEILKTATKLAVDALPIRALSDAIAVFLSDTILLFLPEGIEFTPEIQNALEDFISNFIANNVSQAAAMLLDDVLWSKINCIVYDAIVALPNNLGQALVNAAAALLAAHLGFTDVMPGIALLLQKLGINDLAGINLKMAIKTYDCTNCATTGQAAGPGSLGIATDLVVDDGTHKVTYVQEIEVVGGTVSGSSPKAIITIGGTTPPLGPILMADGLTYPPIPLQSDDGGDWLYAG